MSNIKIAVYCKTCEASLMAELKGNPLLGPQMLIGPCQGCIKTKALDLFSDIISKIEDERGE
ncbi:hypothetical protein LCGC14_1879080 [marine sediment metagenome]|uniref:Uncharacterized protein n=1 Tax=marine sediment metagenome TaxID=412755 RepID=A0A0F9G2R9_9ZZZZ